MLTRQNATRWMMTMATLLALGLGAAELTASAQDGEGRPAVPLDPTAELRAELKALRTEYARLREQFDDHAARDATWKRGQDEKMEMTDKRLLILADAFQKQDAARQELEKSIGEVKNIVATVRSQAMALQVDVERHGRDFNKVVDRDRDGNPRLKSAQLTRAAREVARAGQGKIILYNPFYCDQTIYVNGVAWSARPGESHIYAPVGRVLISRYASVPAIEYDNWVYNDATQRFELRYVF